MKRTLSVREMFQAAGTETFAEYLKRVYGPLFVDVQRLLEKTFPPKGN